MTDSDIINYLGVGIVSFKEKEEEVEVTSSDYEYRVDTDVYTSVTVNGGKDRLYHQLIIAACELIKIHSDVI